MTPDPARMREHHQVRRMDAFIAREHMDRPDLWTREMAYGMEVHSEPRPAPKGDRHRLDGEMAAIAAQADEATRFEVL